MITINHTITNKNLLQEAFLNRILQQLSFNSEIYNRLFAVRYNPKHQAKKLTLREIAKIIKNDYQLYFEEAGINIFAKRVNDKILEVFKQEIQSDGIDVDLILYNSSKGKPKNSVSPYKVTYQWLWEKKLPRMGLELAKEIASPAFDKLNMNRIEKETNKVLNFGELNRIKSNFRGLNLGENVILKDNGHYIKLKESYQLHINLLSRDKYLLLINESVEGDVYLLSPSKAFADVPYTILSEGLYLPPDDEKKGRARFLQYGTEGNEYFLAIVTEQPIELSWVNWECESTDIILNQERLEEIFIKVGQQSNSEAFYKWFKVVK